MFFLTYQVPILYIYTTGSEIIKVFLLRSINNLWFMI